MTRSNSTIRPGWARRWRRGRAALGAALLGGAAILPLSGAQASPLDPGIEVFPGSLVVPYCSAPHALSNRPGWSQVSCGPGAHRFVVPPQVHVLQVDVRGAVGGAGVGGAPGGGGDRVRASIVVAPGQLLDLTAGSAGGKNETGGFNGGGDGPDPGSTGPTASGGGGGSSDIRVGDTGPWTRILSAAGGGGGGGASATGRPAGGNGGRAGQVGEAAPRAFGGQGGQPSTSAGSGAGGSGGSGSRGVGAPGTAGSTTTLIGGSGGSGASNAPGAGDGGGGGGGYGFGGGGAGGGAGTLAGQPASGGGGGGGGGSSYVNAAYLQPGVPVSTVPAANRGNGAIIVTYHAPPIQCGQTINVSMTLTTDLDCVGLPGLVIGGQNNGLADTGIVFDLGGHTILGGTAPDGAVDPNSIGIVLEQNGATVRNGTISGFGTGLTTDLSGYFASHDGGGFSVYHVTITNGVAGVTSNEGSLGAFVAVDHSVISGMSETGIEMSGAGLLQVTSSTLSTDTTGIETLGPDLVATSDVLTANTDSGLDIQADGIDIEHDTIAGGGAGMQLVSPLDPYTDPGALEPDAVTVAHNAVHGGAGTGISLSGLVGTGAVLSGNTADSDGADPVVGPDPGDGISVDLGATAADLTVSGNTARDNAGFGIDAVGVTDGGADVASGNSAGQCRGVTCTG